jgi:AcrR family transcriptional regulator
VGQPEQAPVRTSVTDEPNSHLRNRPRQARSAARVEHLLDVAEEIFEEVGYDAATTNLVASRAGVPVGTLYRWFPDKSALAEALTDRYLDHLVSLYQDLLSDIAPDVRIGDFVRRVMNRPCHPCHPCHRACRRRRRPLPRACRPRGLGGEQQAAIDAAFCSAARVTLAGSMMPALTRSSNSPVAALRPMLPVSRSTAARGDGALRGRRCRRSAGPERRAPPTRAWRRWPRRPRALDDLR